MVWPLPSSPQQTPPGMEGVLWRVTAARATGSRRLCWAQLSPHTAMCWPVLVGWVVNILLVSSSSKCQQVGLQLGPRHRAGKRGSLAADNSSSQCMQQDYNGVHSTDLQGRRPMFSSSYQQRMRLLAWRHLAGKGEILANTSSISKLTACQLLMVPALTQQHCARQGGRSL